MLRVCVTGGRDFNEVSGVFRVLNTIHSQLSIGMVITGGAKGADTHADHWTKTVPHVGQECLSLSGAC